MTKKASNKPSTSAEEALKQQKKQARQEAKLMLEIDEAKKAQTKAQKQQSKTLARLEARSTYVRSLEARLAELRAPGPEPESETLPQPAELEHQQEQSEIESGFASSNGEHLVVPEQEYQDEITSLTDQIIASPQVEGGIDSVSPETGTPNSIDEEQTPPIVEEVTQSEDMVVAKDGTEKVAAQDNETAIERDTSHTKTTPVKANAQRTATRRSTATRKPASQSTVTKRPASRSQSTRRTPSDAESEGT